MSETAQKPTVRFKGFTDPWEQRKVGDHLIESKTKGHTGNSARKITVKLWGKGVVEKNDFGGSEHTQYYERKSGQFIYSKLDFLNAAFGVIPEKLDKYESTADLPAFDPVEINPHFMCFRAIQKDFYLKNGMIADGSRKAKRIHVNVFQAMPISVPSLDEQDKIVTFLQAIDNLITLHQRKYEKLVDVKKALLEKMFPADGENVPQIRFRGFTDPWEQRKLGEAAPLRGGYAFKSEEYVDNGIPIIRISNILSDGTIGADFAHYNRQNDDEIYSLKDGAALLAMSGATTGKVSILNCKNTEKYYQNQRVGYFERKKKFAYEFVSTIVRSSFFAKQLTAVLVAGAQPNVSSKDIDSFEFLFPKDKEEQQKIGHYFRSLDNLITLYQRKLEKLKNIKKALLDKMFV